MSTIADELQVILPENGHKHHREKWHVWRKEFSNKTCPFKNQG